MNDTQIKEIQRINRIKESECIVCEIAIPKNLKEEPASLLYGTADNIEMAIMIQFLEGTIESIKQKFPKVNQILPKLKDNSSITEKYKEIEMM